MVFFSIAGDSAVQPSQGVEGVLPVSPDPLGARQGILLCTDVRGGALPRHPGGRLIVCGVLLFACRGSCCPRKVDIRLPGKGISNSHGAGPVS